MNQMTKMSKEDRMRTAFYMQYLTWHENTTVLVPTTSQDIFVKASRVVDFGGFTNTYRGGYTATYKERQNIYVPFEWEGYKVHLVTLNNRVQEDCFPQQYVEYYEKKP